MSSLSPAVQAPKIGASFFRGNVPGVQTLVTPAANTNGLVIRTFSVPSNTSALIAVYADTAAPTGAGDATKRTAFVANSTGSYGAQGFITPLDIPAGYGLYVCGAGSADAAITWDMK